MQTYSWIFLNLNLADIEWNKLMLPPKAEKVKSEPKRDTKIMEFLRPAILKMHKQWWKICPWKNIFFK